jgi:hypothetical protein
MDLAHLVSYAWQDALGQLIFQHFDPIENDVSHQTLSLLIIGGIKMV